MTSRFSFSRQAIGLWPTAQILGWWSQWFSWRGRKNAGHVRMRKLRSPVNF